MDKSLTSFIDQDEIALLQEFLFSLKKPEPPPIFLHNDILLAFDQYLRHDPEKTRLNLHSSRRFLRRLQEILLVENSLILVYRHRRANCRIYRLLPDSPVLERLAIDTFLLIKEKLVKPDLPYNHLPLKINLAPFYDYGPSLRDPDTIGAGIKHLNFYLSANLAQHPEKWHRTLYEFLKLHQMHGLQLLLDGDRIRDTEGLESALEDAMDFLERCECPDDLEPIKEKLRQLGFLDGWGDNAARILETMQLLQDTLEQPDGDTLEEFLARIPMISKVAIISPHGWFGQENVLGRPDTGGQVVYILDQVKALESFLRKDLRRAGLDIEPRIIIVTRLIPENEGTTSDLHLEHVRGTGNVQILRVPFRDPRGEVVPHWISRFRIWPYLGRFATDVEQELLDEFEGRPDLIVGNYSDGNLVATMLAKNLGVIQCNIAHALEKSKYLFSDLYWEKFEQEYNFSTQFMADIISMNLANFIITSTRQEITGTEETIGQYESYQFFTMPGLMQVTNGINLFHPRFNVIPPGVSPEFFFPFDQQERRPADRSGAVRRLLLETEDENCFGRLEHPDRPLIFSISRLDRIKNITGLVEAYGRSERLREQANLLLIASTIDPTLSRDAEEEAEIRKMHDLIEQHQLHGHIRWIGKLLSKEDTGEAYRVVADLGGIFVQPALFEAFGLTILEAMHSGLPVFATEFGGPQEIIEDGVSGFLINPTTPDLLNEKLSGFLTRCGKEPGYWQTISGQGRERARSRFTWDLYCQRLTRLSKVYGFWKYSTSNVAKDRMRQYCHLLFQLFYKPRADKLLTPDH
ncbi:MAG: sucrose synthase [Desulfobacterales bacterium]|nr:sucrose synthase [Desulfobacterales bacterium]